MSFFGVNVNPFSTPVGQRIEQATDASLPSENWALNMEICDIINETEDGPRDAIKAIKRRLNQAASKNYTVVMYTLVVLETCVKNCGKRFHSLACSRDFVHELVKTIGPKNEPPTVVQEKVLSLIRTWAEAFRHQPHAQGVCQVYLELKGKGIQFPITDLDTMAPIITPERSVPESEQPIVAGGELTRSQPTQPPQIHGKEDSCVVDSGYHQQVQPQPQPQQPQSQPQGTIAAGGVAVVGQTVAATPLHEQLVAKLRSELDVVQGNMRVLGEMLAHLTSAEPQSSPAASGVNRQPEPADLELLQELHATCKAMQERVVELIGRLVDDEMTAELLRINDELNNLFLRYSRYTKNKLGGGQPATPAASAILAQAIGNPPRGIAAGIANDSPVNKLTETDRSLIDLSDGLDPLAAQIADIGISGDGTETRGAPAGALDKDRDRESDEFDMFAQSRNATYETTKNSGSKYEDNMEPVSEGVGLSTAILNRGGNLKNTQHHNNNNNHLRHHHQHNHHNHHQQVSSAVPLGTTGGGSGIAAVVPPGANPSRESEFNEMAAWLDRTPGDRGDSDSLTSSEFERFLAERAAAAEALPTLPTAADAAVGAATISVAAVAPTSTTTTSTPTVDNTLPGNPNIQRQINKDQDKSLFVL